MSWLPIYSTLLLAPALVAAQGQNCYYGPGADYRAPDTVVPCTNDAMSSCCLQGDTCLSGNACYNFESGNTYQYGCTDKNYEDRTCPYKCGFNSTLSPWVGMEICSGVSGVTNDAFDTTWICHSPENCDCEWDATWGMVNLTTRSCKDMGSEARVAFQGPASLQPYVKLPSTYGGSTGYWSITTISGSVTWPDIPNSGYTPSSIGQNTSYISMPTTVEQIAALATVSPSSSAIFVTVTAFPAPTVSTTSTATTSLTTSVSGSYAPSPTTSAAGNPTTSQPVSSPSSSSQLSTGAKVGIGVGIAGGVCGVAALGIAFWLLRRRRRTSQPAPPTETEQVPQQQHPYCPGSPGSPPPLSDTVSPYSEKGQWQQAPYNPYFAPNQVGGYTEAPKSYGVWSEQPKAASPQPSELPAGARIHEIDSHTSPLAEAPSPTPAYTEVEALNVKPK